MRTTIAFDPALYRALKIKSATSLKSVSSLVAEAVRLSLKEDALDLAAFDERKKEPARPFEDVLKELRRDGLL